MPINLNDSTPAAPSGYTNVTWQKDISTPPNMSAYAPLAGLFTRSLYTATQRAMTTAYQNTTGFPLIVGGYISSSGATECYVASSSGGLVGASTLVNSFTASQATYANPFLFLVPPNYYYEITATSAPVFGSWFEFQINSGSITINGDLSSSRALSTGSGGSTNVYQNTNTTALFVYAQIHLTTVNTSIATAYSDTTTTPTAVVYTVGATASPSENMVWIMVPAGHYYQISAPSGASNAVTHWYEAVLPFNAVKSADLAATPILRAMSSGTGADTPTTIQNTLPLFQNKFKDIWMMAVEHQNATGGSLIWGSAPWLSPWAFGSMAVPGSIYSGNMVNWSGGQFVQPLDFYYFSHDTSNTATLDHWWEYTLG